MKRFIKHSENKYFTMSRSFKISFDDHVGEKEVFAVKPISDDFDSLKEELYARKPEFRNKSLKFYYEGKFYTNVIENFIAEKGDVIIRGLNRFFSKYVFNTVMFVGALITRQIRSFEE